MEGADAGDAGWFADLDPAADGPARDAIEEGRAERPREWPRLAVEAGVVDSEDAYYEWLHEVTVRATREAVRERQRADDQQLIHAVRAMDDCESQANELAERVAEWAKSRYDDVETGIEGARAVAGRDPETPVERRLVGLATRVADLADEAENLREFVERSVPGIAPNLAALAGPVLAARLIALAGGLETLARQPSGTVQVLGAEDALFAHLQGGAPSPKHGVIYTHEFVRNTPPENRGSAARALAGKLAIAARVDHYSGQRRPELDDQLRERMETIRARDSA